jgi:hypothetical protein
MKQKDMLTIASLLSLLLLLLHLTDDFIRGIEVVRPLSLVVVPLAAIMLCGTLLLTERRSGYIITLVVGIAATSMPLLHLRGTGTFNITKPGSFFFLFNLFALGVLGVFVMILSARGIWNPKWSQGK